MRVLKPAGKIALFEYTMADDEEFSDHEMDMLNKIIDGSAMDGLKSFRHDKFHLILERVGFVNIKTENINEHVEPSLRRLKNIAIIPYQFVRLFRLQHKFINVTAAVECYKMGKKDLLRYNIFTAEKPKKDYYFNKPNI
jgi:hypothetical protein